MPDHRFLLLNENQGVIQSLFYNEALSSTTISTLIGKSIPNVNKVLTMLVKEGYVEENGYAISSGGRKPLKYSLVAGTHLLISVALSQYSIRIVAIDMKGRFLNKVEQHAINITQLKAEEVVSYINDFIARSSIDKIKVLGIGVTMPGFLSTEAGINYSFLPVEDLSLREYLQQNIQLPIFIENDSTAIALGEQKFGVARQENDAMVINLGWGIGLGMIVGGKIFRGHSGLAGEFSHIPLVKNGKLCTCGKRGCLETESSLMAITEKAIMEMEQGEVSSLANYAQLDADTIINEAIKGDTLSVKLISEAAYNVGQGIAILIHLMDPAVIVLSGKGSVVGKLWLSPIQQAINEHCIPRLAHGTELKVSDLNSKAQLLGGAVLVIESIGDLLISRIKELEKDHLFEV